MTGRPLSRRCLFRVSRRQPPLAIFRPERPTGVSFPHRGVTRARPLHLRRARLRELAAGGSASTPHGTSQVPLRSVPGLSQPLDGFLRALASRACCIPRPRPGLALVQGLDPRPQPQLLRQEMRAPVPLPDPRLIDRSRSPAGNGLGFEALLRRRIRAAEAAHPFFEFRAPPGLLRCRQ